MTIFSKKSWDIKLAVTKIINKSADYAYTKQTNGCWYSIYTLMCSLFWAW